MLTGSGRGRRGHGREGQTTSFLRPFTGAKHRVVPFNAIFLHQLIMAGKVLIWDHSVPTGCLAAGQLGVLFVLRSAANGQGYPEVSPG